MSILEAPEATWKKRFMQKHYSYRDSEDVATVVLTAAQSLVLFAAQAAAGVPGTVYYPFGFNARAISVFNWPNFGEYASGTVGPRGQCYAREILVYVTEDTWIRFISLNPIYLTLLAQGYTAAQITAMGVAQTIVEVEHFVAEGDKDTFYPTYGVAIVFRADSAAGMLYVSIEGNVEGGE